MGATGPTLNTPRLTLRPFRSEDAPALFTILSEPNIRQSTRPPFFVSCAPVCRGRARLYWRAKTQRSCRQIRCVHAARRKLALHKGRSL